MSIVSRIVLLALLTPVEDRSPDVTDPPPYDEFLVIPLRVHILESKDLEEINCGLTDEDIRRIMGKVNGIWNKAGIYFGLESIVREAAENEERFRLARTLGEAPDVPHRLFPMLRPPGTRDFEGLHVYYVHEFDVNGVYFGDGTAFVKETARLREVEGGIDEPIPRVMSHELGHALGLPHRQDRTNLLASGTTGTILNADEMRRAREKARTIRGTQDVASLKGLAEEGVQQGEQSKARRYWSWLAEIPGAGAAEARERLEVASDPRDDR
jgi:hypothetical protein